MNRIVYPVLLFAGICIALAACSSGAYVANPSSNANGSINPLNPLKASQFNWAGSAKFSMNINGSNWTTDSAVYFWNGSLQTNQIYAYLGKNVIIMDLSNVWAGNVYNMGFKTYTCYASYSDSLTSPTPYISALGNSGEVYMTENDSLNFKGQFYFQGVNNLNAVYNFSNGYFNLTKY